MPSKAKTVAEYLAEQPDDRKAALAAVRKVILENLDKDIAEGITYGMIGYFIPHSVYPNGYHCDPKMPLPYAALASQKSHMSLHLMSVYIDGGQGEGGDSENAEWLKKEWAKTGKKLDMGKACIRFKKLEDLPLELIGKVIRRVSKKDYIAAYEKNLGAERMAVAARKAAKSAAPAKPAAVAKKAAPSNTPAAPKKTVAKKK